MATTISDSPPWLPFASSDSNSRVRLVGATLTQIALRRSSQWHLGTYEYLPTNHGFDFYYGAPMTQNECISNIMSPGSAAGNSRFGPCPILNGSTIAVR